MSSETSASNLSVILRLGAKQLDATEQWITDKARACGCGLIYFHAKNKGCENWVAFIECPTQQAASGCIKQVSQPGSHVFSKICEPGTVAFSKVDFAKLRGASPESLRVCQCTPEISKYDIAYRFDSLADRTRIFQVYKDFREGVDYTHFACVPIGPCFPEFKTVFKDFGRRWGFIQSKEHPIDIIHLTLVMFIVHSEEEIGLISRLMEEAIHEVEWPANRVLEFPRLACFGRPEEARILYAEPEGPLIQALANYVAILGRKARNHGLTKIAETDVFHATLARPKYLGQVGSFDARPIIQGYEPGTAPPIDIAELRFVKRQQYDDDKFYHTEARFPLPPA